VVLLLFAYGAYHLLVPAADKMLAPPVAPVPQAASARPRVVKAVPRPAAAPAATVPATTPDQTASVAPQEAPALPGRVYGQQNRTARVVLRVKQSTRVLVQGADGQTYINRTLNTGDSYMVPDVVGTTLTTDNAGAVEVDLDGAPMGNAGRTGQIAENVSLDPQAIADRANNRR